MTIPRACRVIFLCLVGLLVRPVDSDAIDLEWNLDMREVVLDASVSPRMHRAYGAKPALVLHVWFRNTQSEGVIAIGPKFWAAMSVQLQPQGRATRIEWTRLQLVPNQGDRFDVRVSDRVLLRPSEVLHADAQVYPPEGLFELGQHQLRISMVDAWRNLQDGSERAWAGSVFGSEFTLLVELKPIDDAVALRESHRLAAGVATARGDHAVALQHWQTLKQLFPDDRGIALGLGHSYLMTGQFAAAVRELEFGMPLLAGQRHINHMFLAMAYLGLGDQTRAEQALRALAGGFPGDVAPAMERLQQAVKKLGSPQK